MIVRFIGVDGTVEEARGAAGDRLLDLAQAYGQPLEGTCDGQMACSTCHVIVAAEFADLLPPPSEEEEDMLDFAPGATRTSRLACQITLTDALDGLTVRMPGQQADARRR
ncbi:2Fe-2S iron-sulfur cluster-binding protein [Sphingomonas sp. MJ1 (PH-R8)]|uniref:2Fe-2S iron-sulfur cluster-binding protein n=1 Tax=Sphingomonas sp. MJ1 (PH-R8) TaxID=3112950 RepID=UPI003A84D956